MKVKLMALPALLFIMCAYCGAGRGSSVKPSLKIKTKAPEIAGYKKWTLVNAKPQHIPTLVAVACAAPQQGRGSHPSTQGKYIRVFVNEKGKAAMFAPTPHFPPGSVVVKEKLPSASSLAPELLTVMIKRQSGFDTSKGDWEYLVTDGSGKKAYQRGKLANCQSCHLARPNSDYVFRSYLPENDVKAQTSKSHQ